MFSEKCSREPLLVFLSVNFLEDFVLIILNMNWGLNSSKKRVFKTILFFLCFHVHFLVSCVKELGGLGGLGKSSFVPGLVLLCQNNCGAVETNQAELSVWTGDFRGFMVLC